MLKSEKLFQSKKGEVKYFYEQYLSDKEVKLAGILDAIKINGKKANPIEFKQKYPESNQIPYHHLIQLTAQAILLELSTDFEVDEVEIKYQNKKRLKEKTTEETKKETVMIIEELRWNIEKEYLPEPTIHEKKCVDCEYRRVCYEV
jgi:CRISPR-associated protein Cas4